MLSFASNLSNELRDRHSSAFWYIKLYYGDESSFTGLSDRDRLVSGVKYRGLILDWGSLIHTVELSTFQTSMLAMNGLKISNADDKISGGRFSDLFNSQNYVNRKFTLHMGAVGVDASDHAQIAQGIITDQMTQDFDSLTLSLTQDTSSLNVEVPVTRVDASTYTNAPNNNIGKPIPMSFGDFGLRTDIGTIPTSGAEFDRYFVKGYFPAIITNQWDDTDANVVTTPDSEAVVTLDTKNLFMYKDGFFIACEDGNVTATPATPELTFKGSTWRVYFPIQAWNTYSALWANYANSIDGDFDTYQTYTTDPATHQMTTGYRIGQTPKLGELTKVSLMFTNSNYGGTAPSGGSPSMTYPFQINIGGNDYQLTWNTTSQTIDITADYTDTEKDEWSLDRNFLYEIDDTSSQNDDQTVRTRNIGIEIEFAPPQTFLKTYTTSVWQPGGTGIAGGILYSSPGRTIRTTHTVNTPEISEYIYFSGQGRTYGAWIDTINSTARATYTGESDPGYNSGSLIENPVYIIEDILRTDIGLDPSTTGIDIDVASFDAVGNTTDGKLANVFNQSVADIEFAFSQYKFTDGWDLCRELAYACGCILFLSGDGKVKITARERDEDYTTADTTIDYGEIDNIKPGITSLADVRNKVAVNYDMDYAADVLTDTTADAEDATSQGNGVNGISSTQELIADNRFILDDDTATGYSTALLDWFSYRKKTLDFDALSGKFNDLEIGDTINFSDWPTTFKIYGNTITATDIYMITRIQKYPNGCSISCQEVSEVTD